MRPLGCFILFVLLSTVSLSQDAVAKVLRVDSLPEEGLLLDKDWKFIVGDNPAFSNPEYNDSAWEPINPSLDIYDLTQIPKSGIVWFRLRLITSLESQLALTIQQSGASEIYLGGKLIHLFGVSNKERYHTGFSNSIRSSTRYLKAHNGTISVESRENTGTEFKIHLPYNRQQ